ncbi:hypothetical protein ABBQ32_002628 [Trebouxia sp. C0010 RCD-2024]
MATYKLWSPPGNKNAFKGLIAARYVGAKIDMPPMQMGKTNKTPDFLKLNPFGKVPTLETPQGGVFESNAIARYIARLADKHLFGKTAIDMAHVEQWIDFSTTEISAQLDSVLYPLLYPSHFPYDKKKEETAFASVQKALEVLDGYLLEHTFLVGEAVTLADIIAACNLYLGMTKLFDAEYRKDIPNVVRWYTTLVHFPHFDAVFVEKNLCKQRLKYEKPKEQPKEQPKQQQQQQAPKDTQQQKPAQQPTADGEEPAKPAPKPKNPLDALPPSKMILDSWKRLYSNTPASQFKQICVNGLWKGADIPNSPTQEHFEGYDPEGFSMWMCDYKYNDENTVNYVVMNKVGGFLQRIDYVRKYAFGVMCILKNSEGQFPIRGFWIFRGQDIPQMMKDECYDLELYDWKKLDSKNLEPAQKALIESMIAEDDKIEGLEHVECKVFK